MTLPALAPLIKRTQQGSKLTSAQHDYDHQILWGGYNAMADIVNQLVAGAIGSLPTGAYTPYAGTTQPIGFLFANGQVVSQVTYAALFAAIGTAYNTGGEGAGLFRVPDLRGRIVMGCNPMNGSTNGSYSTRTKATVYGAETVSYTPAGGVSQASTASITATSSSPSTASITATLGAISIGSLTSTVNLTNGALSGSLTAGTLASAVTVADHTGYNTGSTSLSINGTGTVTSNTKSGVLISMAACVQSGTEGALDAAPCEGNTVADFTVDISASAIATALSLDPNGHTHTIPTMTHAVTNGAMTGAPGLGSAASNVSVSSATIGGSIPSPLISVGGTIAAPTISIAGSIPVQTFTGTAANIATIQPSLADNWIIKT